MGERITELIGASGDPYLGYAEAQDDLPVRPLDMEQVDIGRTQSLPDAKLLQFLGKRSDDPIKSQLPMSEWAST